MERLSNFNKHEELSFKNVKLEISNNGEPSLTDGKVWLMTWNGRSLVGYKDLDKLGYCGDKGICSNDVGLNIQLESDRIYKLMREYKKEYTVSKIVDSIDDFISKKISIDNIYTSFIISLRDSIVLNCLKFGMISIEDLSEFCNSKVLNVYIIKLIEYCSDVLDVTFKDKFIIVMSIIITKSISDGDDYLNYTRRFNLIK